LVATTRLLGPPIVPRGGEAGPLWALNGDKGNVYVSTADGLFVASLGKDARTAPGWKMNRLARGDSLGEISFGGEHFWPTINQTADGEIYLVAGHNHSSIVRIDGLRSIRRLPEQMLDVTPELITNVQDYLATRDEQRQEAKGRATLQLAALPIVADGQLDDWSQAGWVTLDAKASAAVAVAGDRLCAAFKTGDRLLLTNTGRSWQTLFKTGGALDLMLATQADPAARHDQPQAGDVRLVVTQVDGKTMAVLYRPVVPGTKQPVSFTSPVRTITIDRVEDVSRQVQLVAGKRGDFELSIPLATLGLDVSSGTTILGDIGILRGRDGETVERLYWHNKSTGLVDDIPSEALLTPKFWGRWPFTP
jgi:hypothetical protein